MRIPSGKTDQSIYFVAVDSTDLKTRETGLSSFTVQRSRNGAAEVAYTTPTVTEIDAVNMPGVYALLVDEDTTIASTSDSEEYCLHITQASMAPVTRVIELYRRDTTSGRTLDVNANGEAGLDFDNTSGTLAKGTDITGFNDLAAGDIRTAVGLGSANLDTQLDAIAAFIDTEVAAILADTDNIQTRLPAALVSGRMDASVGAVAADAITAAALAADAGTEIADAILARDLGSGSGAGTLDERTVRAALRFMRNKWSISGTTLTVTKEDDATSAWTSTVTGTPGADPITGSDPA